jgi:hypothetical protein
VDVCADNDLDCNTPYNPPGSTTGVDGEIALPFQSVSPTLVGGLEGYLKITGADLEPDYIYWGFPLSGSSLYTLAEVTPLSDAAAEYKNLDVMPDPTRGSVAVATFDCQFGFAAGVEVKLDPADPATQSFSPTTGASTKVTDSSGVIFFTNVPAGAVQVTATPPGLNRASSHVGATVRPQDNTTILAYPTP